MNKVRCDSTSEVRTAAVQITYEVNENGAYSNLALDKYLRSSTLAGYDRNLLTEIVNGSIRMIKHLDWVLNHFLRTKINKQNKWFKNILRVSLYQILFMERIPDYAAVNSAVDITRRMTNKGLAGVTNGVLRNIIRKKDKLEYPSQDNLEKYLAVYYSHPEWLVEYFLQSFGPIETEKILIYNNQAPGVVIRNNVLKGSRSLLEEKLKAEMVDYKTSSLTPWGLSIKSQEKPLPELNSYQEGCFYVQNDASMLAVPILNPQAGSLVYDLCCGVGGKTTHLAEYMHNKGQIVAFDVYPKKLGLLQENCLRLGINIVKAYSQDILQLDSNMEPALHVMLDAPCSGLGVLNRRADSRWKKTPDDIKKLTNLQTKLIEKAGKIVKPGGLLLYSTCTINRKENEDIVLTYIKNNDFKLENFVKQVGFFPLDDKDKKCAASGMLTIEPGKYNTDGMFYALMRRKYTY